MFTDVNEAYLIKQVLSGSSSAFEQLVRQYEKLVVHIVTPLIGVNEDREDICQDIFLKVYEKLPTFQFKSKLSTWIGNIAYNTSINFLQKKKHVLINDWQVESGSGTKNPVIEDLMEDVSLSPDEIIVEKQQVGLLLSTIGQLPEIQRTILLLFHYDDMSLAEISEITGIHINTVKSHLFRGKKTLKEKLAK